MKSVSLIAIAAFTCSGLLAVACGDGKNNGGGGNSTGGGDGSGGDGSDGSGSGGKGSGSGGKGSGSGGNGSGTGGNATGGEAMGGMGGDEAMGGMGGDMGELPVCSGCVDLFVPFTGPNTGTGFQKHFITGVVDLTGETITANLHIVTKGQAGFVQVYAENGAAQTYASVYSNYVNFGDAADGFINVSFDLTTVSDVNFNPAEVEWIGINVQAGDPWTGATWDDTSVYVDSITFTNGSIPDMTFDDDEEGMTTSPYNAPLAGSTLTYLP